MYQRIRIAVVALVAITLSVLSSGMTLSYFSDTDGKTNSFTIGRASVKLSITDETGAPFVVPTEPVVDGSSIGFLLSATNDGNIPVYQRFRVVIPIALAGKVTLGLDNCEMTGGACENTNYQISYEPAVAGTYAEYYIVLKTVLAAGATTAKSPTLSLNFSGISEEDGAALTCVSSDNNCVFGIKTYADVIQTTGFASASAAFANIEESY